MASWLMCSCSCGRAAQPAALEALREGKEDVREVLLDQHGLRRERAHHPETTRTTFEPALKGKSESASVETRTRCLIPSTGSILCFPARRPTQSTSVRSRVTTEVLFSRRFRPHGGTP